MKETYRLKFLKINIQLVVKFFYKLKKFTNDI